MSRDHEEEAMPDVDPVEFARAMLGISPEDAEKVRERSNPTRKRAEQDADELPRGQHGSTADYGDQG